jgi:hypothetical protein
MDRMFFAATGIEAELLREFVATGADDNEVATWMGADATASRGGQSVLKRNVSMGDAGQPVTQANSAHGHLTNN